jgi:hypothetical protein
MLLPDPPCCRIQKAAGCNESGICSKVGGFGFDFFHLHRAKIFLTLAVLTFCVTIISIIPIVSMSRNNGDVKNTFWTRGEYSDTVFYIGLEKVVFSIDGTEDSFLWSDDKCDGLLSESDDACDECEKACKSVVKVVIMNLVIISVTIMSNMKRSTAAGDLNCTKFMAIFSGFVSSMVMMSSLAMFSNGCYDNLPSESDTGATVTYTHGPAFICVLVPQLFKITEAVIHILTPVPQRKLKNSAQHSINQPLYEEETGEYYLM